MERNNKENSIQEKLSIIEKARANGITLVALIITVIILLILAGITLSLTVGENGIIRKAQEAGRNYQNAAKYEEFALDELMNTTDSMIEDVTNNDKKPYDESEFRKLIAQAITQEGVATTWEDSNVIFVENIGKILQERTKDATATADNITQGKTAYVNGELITGTGEDNKTQYEEGKKDSTAIKVGSCTGNGSINISSMSGYQNYTNSDFCLKIVSAVCNFGLSGSARSVDDKKFYLSPSVSYNSSTGVITVAGCVGSGRASENRVYASVTLTVEVWLQ